MIMHNYLGKLEALRWINLLTLLPSRITGVGSGWRDKVYWRFHYPAALGIQCWAAFSHAGKSRQGHLPSDLPVLKLSCEPRIIFCLIWEELAPLRIPETFCFFSAPCSFLSGLSTWPMHLGLPGETIGAKGSLSQGSQLIWKKIFEQWLHWEACCWNTEQISHSLFQYLPWNPWPNSSERLSLFLGPIPFIRNAYIYSPLFTDPEAIFERAEFHG